MTIADGDIERLGGGLSCGGAMGAHQRAVLDEQ
jgi:hypothetical protein